MDQNKQQEYYDELITGYLNRSLTPEQEKELSRWVAANESHKKHYYEMTELWLSSYDKQHKNGRKKPYTDVLPNRPDSENKNICSYGNIPGSQRLCWSEFSWVLPDYICSTSLTSRTSRQ